MITFFIILVIVYAIKNAHTCKQFMKVGHAIFIYNLICIHEGLRDRTISYDVCKSYDRVLFNPLNWRCKDMIPEREYNLIKRFL